MRQPNTHANFYANQDCNAFAFGNTDRNPNTNSYPYSNIYARSHSDTYGYAYSNT